MTFGKVLQRIRRSKGMTQREVAKKIGMDFSYFSRLENDRFDSNPTSETIGKIADALECNGGERDELIVAAGRITEELEKEAREANKNPEVVLKLFRSAIQLAPEKLAQYAKKMEADVKKSIKSGSESKEDDKSKS
jgi:transcriptional regulator with XRE-family HTH domain